MMRHILGEDLNVGCVLTWGPCWYPQKQFFEGRDHPLSTPDNLMRYDVEVSGFPSSHAGHLVLLRLKEEDYPGATTLEDWPSWDLPVLQWGKAQGAVVGFSHSGWGLEVKDTNAPDVRDAALRRHRRQRVHRRRDPRRRRLHLHGRHAVALGAEHLVPHAQLRLPHAHQRRDRLPVHLRRARRPGPQLRPARRLDFDRWATASAAAGPTSPTARATCSTSASTGVDVGTHDSEVRLARPGTGDVTAQVAARLPEQPDDALRGRPLDKTPYWDLERARTPGPGGTRKVPVEVVVNGRVAATRWITADGTIRDVKFDVPIERSSWVALRILPSSHTNPIFVLVDGQPIRASRQSAEWCLSAVDQCWSQKAPKIAEREKAAAEAAYEHARQVYRRILAETRD